MKKTTIIRAIAFVMLMSVLFLCGCEDEIYRSPSFAGNGDARPAYKDNALNGTAANDTSTNAQTSAVHTQRPNCKGRVALTLDDGPHNEYTRQIVDELEKYGYRATFFVVGNRVDGSAYNGGDAMKYAEQKGNEIAIHAYTHDYYYDTCTEAQLESELKKTEAAIKSKLPDTEIRLMRPVGGRITDARLKKLKYSAILWSIDSEDWKYKGQADSDTNVKIIVDGVMDGVENGDIILMHDIYKNTVLSVKQILAQLDEMDFEVVTVSELLGSDLAAGKKYSYG